MFYKLRKRLVLKKKLYLCDCFNENKSEDLKRMGIAHVNHTSNLDKFSVEAQ